MRVALDTNVLVRYLAWDDAHQVEQAAAVIEQADEVVLSTIVLCEVAWVLKRAYRYAPAEIVDVLRRTTQSRNVTVDGVLVEAGLQMLENGGDFADGVIQAEARRARCTQLVTFDRAFAQRAGPFVVALGDGNPPG